MKNKIIDLFCGCGGMSKGFEMAGFEVAMAIDFWDDAIKTYRHNAPGVDAQCMDIHQLDEVTMAKHFNKKDIVGIIGGPPCQGFSTVGKREIDDPRNQLYLEYCRVVRTVSPEFFVIENVKGLTTLNNGAVKEDIIERFSSMGYHVAFKVLNAADFGVPQNRKRVFFVGMKKGYFKFPEEFGFTLSAKDGISDLPSAVGWDGESKVTRYANKPLNDFQRMMRGDTKTLLNHDFTAHSEQTISIISRIPDGGSIKDLPPEFWQIRKYNKAFERMSSSRPANTVDTGHRNYFHYAEHRIPTVRENARLQSFPDDFEVLGTRGSQYKQIGNAVPPLLAKAVADAIMEQLNRKGRGVKKMKGDLLIKNPSSPGASFTGHTEDTIVSCYNFVQNSKDERLIFTDFQEKLQQKERINKSNLRCILPMLRYAGLVRYNKDVDLKNFFTDLGKQYISVIKLLRQIEEDGVSSETRQGYKEAQVLRSMFLRYALVSIVHSTGCSYANILLQTFRFVQRFNTIDKVEFACLAYGIQCGEGDPLDNASQYVQKHRNGEKVKIQLSVRDDAEGVVRQKDSLGWLTSYNYILALLEQAGIVSQLKDGFKVNPGNAFDFEKALNSKEEL